MILQKIVLIGFKIKAKQKCFSQPQLHRENVSLSEVHLELNRTSTVKLFAKIAESLYFCKKTSS